MRITSLVENSRLPDRPELTAEHGVSLHVQHGELSLLFDTGASEAFADNAARLGVDLAAVDLAVISHHHYDHGGGLARFLRENDHAPIYLGHAPGGGVCHAQLFGFIRRHIGLDHGLLQTHAHRFVEVTDERELAPDVVALANFPTPHPPPAGNRIMVLRQGGGYVPDLFEHELLLVIRTEDGLVVFTGCSHRGILNMVEAAEARYPGERIRALIGGFHLIGLPFLGTMAGSRSEVEQLAMDLGQHPLDRAYTGHCTGDKAYRVLRSILGDRLEPFPTGQVIDV